MSRMSIQQFRAALARRPEEGPLVRAYRALARRPEVASGPLFSEWAAWPAVATPTTSA
jgi:hypothetical protein